jgi:hypothetical protein
VRDALEAHVVAGGQRVADAEHARVVEADDVAGEGLLDGGALAGHERGGVLEPQHLAQAHVARLHALDEAAGADAQERDAVAVHAVHVRLDLEDEAREVRVVGVTRPWSLWRGAGAGAISRKAFRKGSTPKLVSALPKNIGDRSPESTRSVSSGRRPRRAARGPLRGAWPRRAQERRAVVEAHDLRVDGSRTPWSSASKTWMLRGTGRRRRRTGRRRRPTGQFIGHTPACPAFLELLHQVERVAAGRSILLTKVKIGMPRSLQTRKSFFGLGLDALGRVDQHDGASAAASVR